MTNAVTRYSVYLTRAVPIPRPADFGLESLALPVGFHFLVSSQTHKADPHVLAFMRNRCLTKVGALRLTASLCTTSAYAYTLTDLYDFLDFKKIPLAELDLTALTEYQETLTTQVSPVTKKPYATETINLRMWIVKAFVLWCQNNGYLKNRFEVEELPGKFGRNVTVLEPDLDSGLSEPDDFNTAYIDTEHLPRLIEQFGQWQEMDGEMPLSGPRNRLMVECALQAGLRRAEVCGLRLTHVNSRNLEGRDPYSTVAIRVFGKGAKWRSVPFPVWLVRAMQNYAAGERARSISRRIACDPDFKDTGFLFVHREEACGSWGDPVSPKQLNRIYAAARIAAVEEIVASDPTGIEKGLSVAQSTFHSLRHNFALHTYVLRRANGDTNPGKYVQAVLGHKFQSTTDLIYLNASYVYEAELSEVAQKLFSNMVNRYG